MNLVWIPESIDAPGLFANARDGQPPTHNMRYARKFDQDVDCQDWCDRNPVPGYVPHEHDFQG